MLYFIEDGNLDTSKDLLNSRNKNSVNSRNKNPCFDCPIECRSKITRGHVKLVCIKLLVFEYGLLNINI